MKKRIIKIIICGYLLLVIGINKVYAADDYIRNPKPTDPVFLEIWQQIIPNNKLEMHAIKHSDDWSVRKLLRNKVLKETSIDTNISFHLLFDDFNRVNSINLSKYGYRGSSLRVNVKMIWDEPEAGMIEQSEKLMQKFFDKKTFILNDMNLIKFLNIYDYYNPFNNSLNLDWNDKFTYYNDLFSRFLYNIKDYSLEFQNFPLKEGFSTDILPTTNYTLEGFDSYVDFDLLLKYNDITYVTSFNKEEKLRFLLNKVIYVEESDYKNDEDIIDVIKTKIKDETDIDVEVVKNKLLSEYDYDFNKLGNVDNMLDYTYNITIGGVKYDFVVEKIKRPLPTPAEEEKTDILKDTILNIKDISDNTLIQKYQNILNKKVYKILDITLYSPSNDTYITKIEDDNYQVKISLGADYIAKSLIAYYINEDNSVEEHEVTIDEEGNAIFITNHFSTYILAEKQDINQTIAYSNNPETGNNINNYYWLCIITLLVGRIILNKSYK